VSADPVTRAAEDVGSGTAGAGTDAGTLGPVRGGRYAEPALVAVTLVGFAAAWLHWTGLVVAGVLLGLLSPTLPRAVVHGLTFGGLVLLGFGGWLALAGVDVLAAWLSLGPPFLVSVGAGLGLPTLAAVGTRALR
jgi:hypothetical protein